MVQRPITTGGVRRRSVGRRNVALLLILAVAALSRSIVASPGYKRAVSTESLVLEPGREFSAESYVHRKLRPNEELDPRSESWVAELQRQIRAYKGIVSVNVDSFSPPIYIVGPGQPTIPVKAERTYDPSWSFDPLQQRWQDVPLPNDFAPSAGTDKEAIIYQPATGRYWEFWLMERTSDRVVDSAGRVTTGWRAGWGGRVDDLRSSPGYFPTTTGGIKFGTAATGLILLAGVMTIDELRAGDIAHSLHFSLPEAREADVWAAPAQRSDGLTPGENAIPQGATFRLPADLDLASIDMDPFARMMAKAVQSYGMVLRDRAGVVTFYAENPGDRAGPHPYFGPGGILRCPEGRFASVCAPDRQGRLKGFPWEKLQALRANIVETRGR